MYISFYAKQNFIKKIGIKGLDGIKLPPATVYRVQTAHLKALNHSGDRIAAHPGPPQVMKKIPPKNISKVS